jgi:hypothetical protein
MVTCYEVGDGSHNRDEESDERRAVETPLDLDETVRSLRAELQICKANNERLIKEKEKQTEINAVLLQSLSYIQRQLQHEPTTNHMDRRHVKRSQSLPEIQKHGPISDHTRRSMLKKAQPRGRGHSSGESFGKEDGNSKESSSRKTISHSQRKGKKRKHSKSHDPEEFKKAKPPSFDGEVKKGEEAEACLLGLKKYFRVHDYSENLKARITIFNLDGKASIWWEYLRNVKGVHEKDFSWKQFDKYFRKKYLSEKYMDGKTKELYELRLGQLTIDEYVNKFLELLRYVPYIKAEKVKVQRLINGLAQTYRDRIVFDERKTL